ncbi:MAG: hydroxymethylglutaryl-CoA lyase [Burkholderiales bacterium]|nr:hydroxymethylglutaryl-CoA lyase [Burkholderiales bacterium]
MEFVTVNEVGPRDGLQNQPALIDTAGKLQLIRVLVEAGVRHIEATSFVSPKAVPQMADAAELYAALPARGEVDYSVLVPNLKGYERARAAGAKAVAVVLSATETMNLRNINMTLAQARQVCRDVLGRARTDGVAARAYVAVAFACPYEGPTPAGHVVALADEMFAAGAAEVVVADTIGAASPAQVFDLFKILVSRCGAQRLSGHFHDTRALALANVWAALQAGIRKFDSSVGGLGGCPFAPGASGNLATEDLMLMLSQCGYETGIDVTRLRAAVKVAEGLVGRPLGGRMLPWLESQERRKRKEQV